MNRNSIVVNLPRDLGDCMLATAALARINAYCRHKNFLLLGTGSDRSFQWVKDLCNLEINKPSSDDDLIAIKPAFIVDLNAYHTSEAYGIPVHAMAKMKIITEDGPALGAGAAVGEKHISLLLEDTLKRAGILAEQKKLPPPFLPPHYFAEERVAHTLAAYGLSGLYALLIPVASPGRPAKQWQPEKFAAIARHLDETGIRPVLIGGPAPADLEICAAINRMAGGVALDLCGRASIPQLAALGKKSAFCVGNDTGPTHIMAATGTRVFCFFGYYNDPATWRPVAPQDTVTVIQGKTVGDITFDQVKAAFMSLTLASQAREMSPSPYP